MKDLQISDIDIILIIVNCKVPVQIKKTMGNEQVEVRSKMMETTTFTIPNISCGHCVMAIQREIGELEGVIRVEGDPSVKQITVGWNPPANLEKIKSVLGEINYPATD